MAAIATTNVDEMGAARERLRAATRAVEATRRKAEAAETAARRASEIVQRARVKCECFRDLDKRIHQFRVDAVRSGTETKLPKELKAQLRARVDADEELESALAISKTLGAESVDALRELERAQSDLSDAAAGVVLVRAQEVARELAELNRRRHGLRLLLSQALAVVPFAHIRGDRIVRAVEDPEPQLPLDHGPEHKAAAWWLRQRARLIADADAHVDELPSHRDLWGFD